MKTTTTAVSINYFGKLPSRGDFVKTNNNHKLVALLDRWAGAGLEILSRDIGWKRTYDLARPIHFAFVGSQSNVAIAGHFMPSRDASDRRFPFMAAAGMEVSQPLPFFAHCPMSLSRLWALTERHSQAVISNEDPTDSLRVLSETSVDVVADAAAYDAPYDDFREIQTVGSLQTMLEQAGHDVSVRGILLGLGDLMAQVMVSGVTHLQKGLALPLPAAGPQQNAVATLWSDLLAGFLGRGSFELVMLVDAGPSPWLTIGFNGAHDRALCSVLDPYVRERYNVVLDNPDWIDEITAERYGLKRLASYLDHDGLSLRTARDTFRETFLGS